MCLDMLKGVCTCEAPFRGPDCSIDGGKPLSIVKTEMICNGICQNVVITGEGFFESDAMQCEFTKIEVSNAVVTCLHTIKVALSFYWKFIISLGTFALVNKLKQYESCELLFFVNNVIRNIVIVVS